MAQEELDRVQEEARKLGKSMGFVYPDTAPVGVVFGGQERGNYLSYQSLPSYKLPTLANVKAGLKNLTEVRSRFYFYSYFFIPVCFSGRL